MAGILDTETDGLDLDTSGSSTGLLDQGTVEDRKLLKRKGEATTLVRKKLLTRDMKGQDNSIINTKTEMIPRLDTGIPNLNTELPDYPKMVGTDFDAVESSVYDKDGWGFNTMDFLFGSEAAVVGIAHDADGYSWSMDNLKQQWSEQPIWVNALSTASLVGTMLLPATLAIKGAVKTGGLATRAAKGTAKETAELARWIDLDWVGKSVKKYDDIAGGQKAITELRRLEIANTAAAGRMKRAIAVEAGELTWKNPLDRARHGFEKRFSNTYFEAINGDPASGKYTLRDQFHERLDKLWKREEVGQMMMEMPEEAKGVAISAYLMAKNDPAIAARVARDGTAKGLTKVDKKWADMYWEWEKRGQSNRLTSGFIDQATYDRIGEGHLATLSKATPDANLQGSVTHMVPISKKTLKGAKKQKAATGLIEEEVEKVGLFGRKKVKEVVPEGEYSYVPVQLMGKPKLDSPTMLHRVSTNDEVYDRLISGRMISAPGDLTAHGYLTSEMLHDNFKFIRDLSIKPENIATAEEIAMFAGDSAKAAKAGFVSLNYAGDGAAATLRRMISKKTGQPEEALPWIRKALFDEIFGQGGMMNQTTMAANNFMGVATTIFKTMKTGFSVPTHLQNVSGNIAFMSQSGFNVVDPKNIAMLGELKHTFNKIADVSKAAKKYNMGGTSMFGDDISKAIDLGKIKVPGPDGKMVSFNMNEEFFNNPVMKEILEESSFHSAESAGHLDDIATTLGSKQYMTKGLVKSYAKMKDVAQLGGKAKWMDWMTTQYLAEDMVPKMGLYLHFRAQGMTQKAAATIVARRLPMYNTVGSAISLGRKWAFPWATFSTEAARITKNNLMDHPLRMMPWLRAPQIMQSMASGAGYAPETRDEVEAAKKQLPFWAQKGTTVMTEGKAGAGAGGAMLGGMAGGFLGGFSGGGASGVVAGGAMGAVAGGLLAAMTTDEDHSKQLRGALQDWLPHSTFTLSNTSTEFGGDWLPFKDVEGMLEQSPIEPMAILQPMLSIMKGEDQFGRAVDPEVGGALAKTIAASIGFLAPPVIQKYGFKITTPQTNMPGDPTGVTNINRLLIDTGNAIDPQTGMPGSLNHDFFLNNVSLWKSYAATGETQLANEGKTEKHMQNIRNHISRNLAFHLENGNDTEVVNMLSRVQGTFAQQFAFDPRQATAKYGEWLEKYTEAIGRHPKLRNWTEDELKERLQQSLYTQGEARSAARDNMLQAMRDELTIRSGGAQNTEMFKSLDLSVDESEDLSEDLGIG